MLKAGGMLVLLVAAQVTHHYHWTTVQALAGSRGTLPGLPTHQAYAPPPRAGRSAGWRKRAMAILALTCKRCAWRQPCTPSEHQQQAALAMQQQQQQRQRRKRNHYQRCVP